jgi:hypothetical protein
MRRGSELGRLPAAWLPTLWAIEILVFTALTRIAYSRRTPHLALKKEWNSRQISSKTPSILRGNPQRVLFAAFVEGKAGLFPPN